MGSDLGTGTRQFAVDGAADRWWDRRRQGCHARRRVCRYSPAAAERSPDANGHPRAHSDTHSGADSDSRANGHAGANANSRANGDAGPNTDTHSDPDRYPCADADAGTDANGYASADSHSGTNPGANASSHADARSNSDTGSDPDTHAETDADTHAETNPDRSTAVAARAAVDDRTGLAEPRCAEQSPSHPAAGPTGVAL